MASQVMTVSRICVLLWFTIFFETVRTTTPSTFTDADTSPLATETVRTTTASTFTDADTSPYATETVTTPSTFTDADTSPYATGNTTGWVTSIPTTGTLVPTSTPPNHTNLDIENIIIYTLFALFVGSVAVIIVLCIYLKCCRSDKSPWAIASLPSPKFQTTGYISRVELWKMVEYATRSHENDKFGEVISSLTKDGTYGSTGNTLRRATSEEESDYQKLVIWKEKYNGATLKEIYRLGFEAGMRETMKKLQVFRGNVSNMVPSTDLEYVLWQIGGKSPDNIFQLLKKLSVNSRMQPYASLKEMVNEARDKLQVWQPGYVPINPVVMLSLALEEFQISPLEEEFFQVPENKKKTLEEAEKKKYVRDATIRHCERILEIVRSKGGDDVIVISKTLDENNKALFDTYRMVEDWLKEQETNNYKKRRALEDAIKRVEISEPDDGHDLFSAKAIREEVSKFGKHRHDGKVKAAWKLLMTDILPFAKALGVDESKLTDYKPTFQDSHLKMGTVGLVSKLVD